MSYQITFVENPNPKDVQVLNNGIMVYAKQKKGFGPIRFFAFFVRDENEQIIGGCSCDMLYGCVYIGSLWVSENFRGKGYGTQLMQKAEKLANENNCNFISVNTMDWEALNFYKKLGYYVEFERHGFIGNSVFFFLRKDLK